jgi:hypothetical protein
MLCERLSALSVRRQRQRSPQFLLTTVWRMSDKVLTRSLVRPGTNFSFTRRNSSEDFGCDKTVAKEETADLIAKIDALQFTLVDHKGVLINLHVSKDEHRVRLQSRVDDPTKRWKFRTGDLEDRQSLATVDGGRRDCVQRDEHGERAVVRGPHRSEMGS